MLAQELRKAVKKCHIKLKKKKLAKSVIRLHPTDTIGTISTICMPYNDQMLHISYQYMTIYHQNPCPISGI